jgi:beta-carotene hydroxylase
MSSVAPITLARTTLPTPPIAPALPVPAKASGDGIDALKRPAQSWGPFIYKEDVVPAAIVTAGVAASLAPFVIPMSVGAIACLLPVAIAARIMAPVHQHHHSHYKIFKNRILNGIYDGVLMLAAGNITAGWQMQHVRGHHKDYLDHVNDVAGSKRFASDGRFRRLIYTLKGDALSLADSWRIAGQYKDSAAVKRRIVGQVATQVAVNGALLALNPVLALATFVVPNAVLRWAVFWHSFEQHDSAPATDSWSGSINKSGTVQHLLLNVGHHTAHHKKPTLHWSRLPAFTDAIRDKIPAECWH